MSTRPFFIEGIGGMKVAGAVEHTGATICLHGGPGGNCLTLYPFFPAERLQGDWYFADLPNHGRSEGTDGDWSPEACIAMLEGFADALEGPLRVAGLSWGANVALTWAAAHPERFQAMLGISGAGDLDAIVAYQSQVVPTLPPEVLALMARSEHATGEEARYLSNRIYIETLPFWMRGNPGLELYLEKTLAFCPDPVANAAYTEHWLLPHLRGERTRQQLRALQRAGVPALLIRGQDDRMGDAPCAMDAYADGTGARVVRMAQAGHCPFVDQPDRFFATVARFFRELRIPSAGGEPSPVR